MRLLIAILSVLPSVGLAESDVTGSARPVSFLSGDYLLQVMASLGLVIGLLLLLLWLLRRFNGVGRGTTSGAALSVVATVGLGQRERAVLISAGDKQILVGVAPGHISALHVFDEPLPLRSVSDASGGMRFADALRQVASGGSKA